MGVPSLFRSVITKYPTCCSSENTDPVEHLYLDFNCLIHHCNNNLVINKSMCNRDIEEELIIKVISYTSHIITNVIKPTKLVFIAFDGPVNMGKIHQQRLRRYKKIQDEQFIKKLKEKHNIEENQKFNSNKITPGTVFMTKLANRIKNLIMLNAFSSHIPSNKKFTVFMSDSNIPGEGEHKIINFMKNSTNTTNSVIYGLDADLIILSMCCPNKNIKLLREPQNTVIDIAQCNPNAEFIYLDINNYTDSFILEYNLTPYEKVDVLNDIIFVSFFGGNDFVEPFINTKMRENNNFVRLMNIYTTILSNQNKHLIQNNNINYDFFVEFISEISQNEDQFVKRKQSKQYNNVLTNTSEDKYKEELQYYEHSFYNHDKNPFYEYYQNDFLSINFKLPHEVWKKQYYDHFNIKKKEDVCNEYIKSLIWTYLYYTKEGVPSHSFYYKYRVAPFASDLFNFVKKEENKNSLIYKFQNDCVISPIKQLLIVTPYQHYNLLPWSYQIVIKELQEFYPHKFKLDVIKGGKNIYSDPILPEINFNFIDTILETVPVSEIEAIRNKIKDKIFYYKI